MNNKKLKWAGLFLMAFCINLMSFSDLNAQTQQQRERDKARIEAEKAASESEMKSLSTEERKAALKEKGKKLRQDRRAVNKYKHKRNADADKKMYTALKMTDDQIKKYEEMNKKYSELTTQALEKNQGDSEALQAAMQEVQQGKDQAIAKIFTGDQRKEYEIFMEDEATKRTSKKYRHKVKNIDSNQ